MLKCRQSINGQFFYTIVLPHMLIGHILELSHNKLSHNGINRTYALTLLLERHENFHCQTY